MYCKDCQIVNDVYIYKYVRTYISKLDYFFCTILKTKIYLSVWIK